MGVTLRPVTPEDENFLLEVYASTRADEMKLVPWDEAQREAFLRMQCQAQLNHYRQNYPDARHDIILLDERPVGRLYIDMAEEAISILDIAILPQYRGAGIGTPLIKEVMEEGARVNKPVLIYVDTNSPALPLFQRLGFFVVQDDGINTLMKWQPSGGS